MHTGSGALAHWRLRLALVSLGSTLVAGIALVAPSASAADGPQDGPAPAQPSASPFQAIGTALAYDSTAGDGPVQAGSTRVAALAGLPAEARSALVLLTASHADKRGAITVRRTENGSAVAKLAFRKRVAKSAVMLVPVSEGHLVLKASKKSKADVKVDLLGYDLTGRSLKAKGRPAVALAHGRWVAGTEQTLAVARQHGAPGTKKLVAALLKITTRQAVAAGGVQVYPVGGTPASPVAPIAMREKTSTIALVPTGAAGQLNVSATVDARVRVELIGYVADTEAPAPPAAPPQPSPATVAPSATPPAQAVQEPSASGAAAIAVQYAMAQVGDRYVAGGVGPDAFDCSGLTMAAWAAAGVKLTHQSYTQYDQTQHIALADIQPGDLLFYFGNGLHHVTIYVGNGQMVNAANPAAGVVLSAVSEPWYAQHLTGVGRVVTSS